MAHRGFRTGGLCAGLIVVAACGANSISGSRGSLESTAASADASQKFDAAAPEDRAHDANVSSEVPDDAVIQPDGDVPEASSVGSVPGAPLPSSLKGYELYAYREGDVLWFTLITGTNRLKTEDEVRVREAEIIDGDWVVIGVSGLSRLADLVARVPAQVPVVLTGLAGLDPLSPEQRAQVTKILSQR